MKAWIVGAPGDALVERLPAALRRHGWGASTTPAEHLSDLAVTLDGERCLVEGEPVSAVVFRAGKNEPFSASYPPEDRAFCDAETRAVWLAVLHAPGVVGCNRLDAVAWFEAEHWTGWRRALLRRGLPLAPCTFGGARAEGARVWVPFAAPAALPDPGDTVARAIGAARFREGRWRRSLTLSARVIDGPRGAALERAAGALHAAGAMLAEFFTDEHGDVAWVDTLPRDLSDARADLLAAALAGELAGAAR